LESTLKFLIDLGILLLGANIGGLISQKLKQPAVLGQIIVGIVLGISILKETPFINHMSELGVIFLMFIAGLETDVKDLQSSIKSSAIIALGGVIAPLVLVGGASYLITGNILTSIFLGIISTATSVGISVQTLKELGHLQSRQGIGILGAAIIDDIVGIILLTLIIGAVNPSSGGDFGVTILKIILFFVLTVIIGYILIKVLSRFKFQFNISSKVLATAVITCFLMAYLSEELGVAAVTGAYFAGVIFSMTSHRHSISHDIQLIGDSIFIPVFFVSIGLGIEFSSLGYALSFSIILLTLGIISKVIGSGLGAKLSGFNNQHSLQIGIGMIPRAEVAIIIANLGLKFQLIGEKEFASVILLVLGTTLITPSLLKWSFKRETSTVKEERLSLLIDSR